MLIMVRINITNLFQSLAALHRYTHVPVILQHFKVLQLCQEYQSSERC